MTLITDLLPKNDSPKAHTGKLLMLVGIGISSIPWGFFPGPGFLAFIIGIILLWVSELRIKSKLLWTIIPVTIWIPIMWFCLIGYHQIRQLIN